MKVRGKGRGGKIMAQKQKQANTFEGEFFVTGSTSNLGAQGTLPLYSSNCFSSISLVPAFAATCVLVVSISVSRCLMP